jgi:hypothetical protein
MTDTYALAPLSQQTLAGWHRFVASGEADVLAPLLAETIVFRSPFVQSPIPGRAATLLVLTTVVQIFENFRYQRAFFAGPHDAALEFGANVGQWQLKGIDLIQFNAAGEMTEFEVMIRPIKARRGRLARRWGTESAHNWPDSSRKRRLRTDRTIHCGAGRRVPRLRDRWPCGKDRPPCEPLEADSRVVARCRSSVVEHSIGNGEVDSSILSGSTIFFNKISLFASTLAMRRGTECRTIRPSLNWHRETRTSRSAARSVTWSRRSGGATTARNIDRDGSSKPHAPQKVRMSGKILLDPNSVRAQRSGTMTQSAVGDFRRQKRAGLFLNQRENTAMRDRPHRAA